VLALAAEAAVQDFFARGALLVGHGLRGVVQRGANQ
jgi:hypothetical protein